MNSAPYRGEKGTYRLDTRLGEGRFGQAWAATVTAIDPDPSKHWLVEPGPELNDRVVIKWPHLRPDLSPARNREFLQDVNAALNSELSALKLLADLTCVARVRDFGHLSLEIDHETPQLAIFLVEEYLTGSDLDQYLLAKYGRVERGSKAFSGIRLPRDFFQEAFGLTYALRAVHQRGVIHGDIWEKNIKVTEQGVRFFDFGASAIRRSASLHPGRLAGMRSDPFVAPEVRRGERHGRRSDIYSMGGLLYYMSAGHRPLGPIPDNDELKSSVAHGIDTHNPTLLAANCGIADIIARCMRYDKDARTRDANALLNELRLMAFADLASPNDRDPDPDCVACLLKGASVTPLFSRMLRMDAARLKSRGEDTQRGILEISGDHEDLVFGMSTYLSVLGPEDLFFAKATPRFWSVRNMGVNGRFLSMLKLVAQRGARVKHVLLVCETDRHDVEARRVLEAHQMCVETLSSEIEGSLEFFCKPVSAEKRDQLIRERHWELSYAICGGDLLTVQPVYDSDNTLRTVRFIREDGLATSRSRGEIDRELSDAMPLRSWLRPTGPP